METNKGYLWGRIRRLAEDVWGYLGTVTTLALLAGVLGMGIYHMTFGQEKLGRVAYFQGARNSRGAALPVGVSPLPADVAEQGGMQHVRFEYGDEGLLERLVHVGGDGEVCAMPGSAVAEQHLEYDEHGRLLRKCNKDANGAPAEDAAGVACCVFVYAEDGRESRMELYDAQGTLVQHALPGYAVELVQYDESGRPLVVEYRDAAGKPVRNAEGEERVVFEYRKMGEDGGGVVLRRNWVQGKPMENVMGYAVEQCEFSADGREQTVRWFDADMNPVHHSGVGGALCRRVYGVDGTPTAEFVYASDGAIVPSQTKRYVRGESGSTHVVTVSCDGTTELRPAAPQRMKAQIP